VCRERKKENAQKDVQLGKLKKKSQKYTSIKKNNEGQNVGSQMRTKPHDKPIGETKTTHGQKRMGRIGGTGWLRSVVNKRRRKKSGKKKRGGRAGIPHWTRENTSPKSR